MRFHTASPDEIAEHLGADGMSETVTVSLGNEGASKTIGISIAYGDTRFAQLPFVPDLTGLQPVTVQYYVTDPSG